MKKDYGLMLFFTLFLGWVGAHHLYRENAWLGLAYLLFCWTGITFIVAFVEFIILAIQGSGRFYEKNKKAV